MCRPPRSSSELTTVSAVSDITETGESLVVVASVNDAVHVRIFNADGKVVVDKSENEFDSEEELANLKALAPFSDPDGLPRYLEIEIMDQAASVSGHALGRYRLFETLPKFFGIRWDFHLQLLIIVPICLMAWLTVTFLTRPEPGERLRAFYKRVQPGGFWGPYREDTPGVEPVTKGLLINFIGGMFCVYGATFGIGYFILLQPLKGAICAALSIGGFILMWTKCLRHLKGAKV